MRVFVTGGTGFVGRAVCAALVRAGHEATVLALPDDEVAGLSAARVLRGDLTVSDSIRGALQGMDAVVHLAGVVGYGVPWSVCRAVNVEGTRNVAAEAVAAGVRRFVHMSSVSVYGRVPGVRLDERAPMREIGDPYGDTKIAAERLLSELSSRGELDLTVLRPTVIYGSGDRLLLPKLVQNLQNGARIIGRGDHPVDLVHVDDVAAFIVAILSDANTFGQTVNLNDPANPTWKELLARVAEAIGVPPPTSHVPYVVALGVAGAMELASRFTGRQPRLTRYGVRVVGRRYHYVADRAVALGFRPSVPATDAITRLARQVAEEASVGCREVPC